MTEHTEAGTGPEVAAEREVAAEPGAEPEPEADADAGAGAGPAVAAEPEPRLLADLDWVLAQAAPAQSGAVWRLAEAGRQVEANLIRLRPGQRIDTHEERDVDVLLLPVAGGGTLHTGSGPITLVPHALSWLPRGSRRSIEAGPDGLAYLTVHRTRTGMSIRMPAER